MDPRSIQPGLAAVQHPLFMIHPKTGEMLQPLMWSKAGRPAWPVMGGAPEDEDDNPGDDEDDSEDDDDEDESDEDGDNDSDDDDDDSDEDKDKKKGKKKNPAARIKALEEEKDRHFKARKKAERELKAVNERLKALEDKDLKPEDKEKRDKEERERREKETSSREQRLRLENAFLKANEIDWVKPEQALAILLADPDEYDVEFDEDGKIDRKSLRAELKRLAKANPHLVKKAKATKADDDDEDGEGDNSQRQTAPKMNGRNKGKTKKEPTRAELARKFPALNRLSPR